MARSILLYPLLILEKNLMKLKKRIFCPDLKHRTKTHLPSPLCVRAHAVVWTSEVDISCLPDFFST